MFAWSAILVSLVTTQLISATNPPVIDRSGVTTRKTYRAGTESARLDCRTRSGSDAIISWDKDGEEINFTWERLRVQNNGLRIRNLQEEDTGRYTCTATNGFGTTTLEYLVYVYPDTNDTVSPPFDQEGNFLPDIDGRGDPPQFTNPDQMHVERFQLKPVASTVRLRCKASGRPRPTIVWYHNGRLIPSEAITYDVGEDGLMNDKWTLKLSEISVQQAGSYMCRVINRAGAVNFTYTLEVVAQLTERPLLLAPHPINQTVYYGGTAQFSCSVRSDVQPHIQWLKRIDSSRELARRNDTINVENEEFVILRTSSVMGRNPDGSYLNKLTITSATEKDAGMYICFGANSMGYNLRSAFLTVRPNPRGGPDGSGYNPNEYNPDDDSDESSTPSLALIIGVPAAIVLVIIIAVVYILQKRRQKNSTPKTKTVARPQRAPAPVTAPAPSTSPYGASPPPDKYCDHRYVAMPAQPTGQVTTYVGGPHHYSGSDNSGSKNYSDYNSEMVPHQQPQKMVPGPQPQQIALQQQQMVHGPQSQQMAGPPQQLGPQQPQTNQHMHYHYGC